MQTYNINYILFNKIHRPDNLIKKKKKKKKKEIDECGAENDAYLYVRISENAVGCHLEA